MKEYAEDYFDFDGNSGKFSKRVQNAAPEEKLLVKAISPFTTVFSKDLH